MFPAISDLINYIFGTHLSLPIQTYGFFVACAYLTGVWVMRNGFKLKEKKGLMLPVTKKVLVGAPAKISELILMGVMGLLLGYKIAGVIIDYRIFSEDPQAYLLSLQGSIAGAVIIGAAVVIFRWYGKRRNKLEKPEWKEVQVYPHEYSGSILIITAVAGLVGAKLFHNLENFGELIRNPVQQIFSFMGLTFYGGMIGGTLAIMYFAWRNRIDRIHLLDVAAPAIAISYGIGRLGCMLAGDGCWGIVNTHPKPGWLAWLPDWMWSYNFPHNVIGEGIPIDHCTGEYCKALEHPVYPTSFYDFVIMGLFFVVLLLIRNKVKTPGYMFCILLVFLGIQRMFMEHIRINNKYDIVGMKVTQAEIISVLLIGIGVIGFVFLRKRKLKAGMSADGASIDGHEDR